VKLWQKLDGAGCGLVFGSLCTRLVCVGSFRDAASCSVHLRVFTLVADVETVQDLALQSPPLRSPSQSKASRALQFAPFNAAGAYLQFASRQLPASMHHLVFSTYDVRCTVHYTSRHTAVYPSVDFYSREPSTPFDHQILDYSQRMSINVRMRSSLCILSGGCWW